MSQESVKCPNCGHAFNLDEAFSEHFEEEKRKAIAEAVAYVHKKSEQDLENAKTELENTFQEDLEKQRAEILKQVAEQTREEYDLQLAQKDEQLNGIKRQLEELKRKAEQGSQQLQGEALEDRLEESLRLAFPLDEISEVKKGQSGADILHKVRNRLGQHCGTIIWEAKNTKSWGKDWIEKLKNDQSQSSAEVMAIVSIALPDGVKTFDLLDGVWVCGYSAAIAMATALRENLTQVSQLRRALQGQENKTGEVYVYLTSTAFKNHITRIVDTFQTIDAEIERERSAMEKIWKIRREHLKRVMTSTTDMVAELQAIIGKDMPEIMPLTPPSLLSSESLNLQ